jgi:hypothetical protein
MRVKLLAQHIIDGTLQEKGTIIDVTSVTPLMEALDEEAKAALEAESLRVYARYAYTPHGWPPLGPMIDSPPIPRPIDNNQPDFHYVGVEGYLS